MTSSTKAIGATVEIFITVISIERRFRIIFCPINIVCSLFFPFNSSLLSLALTLQELVLNLLRNGAK